MKLAGLFCLLSFGLFAQGTQEDYQRAHKIKDVTQNKVYNEPKRVIWADDNRSFFYNVQTKEGEKYYTVESETGKKKLAFDSKKLSKELGKQTDEVIDFNSLPLGNAKYADGKLEFTAFGKKWEFEKDKLTSLGEEKRDERSGGYWGRRFDEREGRPVVSPDKKWTAYIKNHNVYIYPTEKPKEEFALSFDGSPGEYYSAYMVWSPNSEHLAVNKIRPTEVRQLTLIESSPESQLQPKIHTRDYVKPGDALPQKTPTLFSVKKKSQVSVPSVLIENQYSVSNPVWRKDSRAFTFEFNPRGHQGYSVVSVDAVSGKATELITEKYQTFFHYSGKKFRFDTADGNEIIWMSERDGWNHLYLYDGQTGKVKNQITKGNWVVRKVLKVDEQNRRILFEGSGKNAGQDPYFTHYYSVKFDGSDFRELTTENGNHKTVFSPDYSYFVDTYGRLDQPSKTVLRNTADGKVIAELEQADTKDLLATGWKLPEVFTAKGRDGVTDIWGMIIRPSNFDPNKKYPVIEYIYAGPHDSFVPKNFVTDSRGDLHQLVELGFIVVQIDGMGTSNRSKAFHDVCWQNLKDSGFPDRIKWIQAAAAKYPYMDLSRIGIFGNSAGGQSSAGALLHHPDFYKVAVSSSGCHDNRMDKIWWNEQWMGYPIGKQYEESSNVTHGHKIQGKMLLILGELDDNVDPSSTFQLVNAIIKAGKWVDLLFVPGMGHSLGGDYGEHRRRDFFIKHLLGVDPPEWEGHINTSGK